MDKAAPGFTKFDPQKESHAGIGLESGAKKPKVSRETFWVSKGQLEIAEWFCQRIDVEPKHEHGKNSPCFTVIFNKDGSPFEQNEFKSDNKGYAHSGPAVVEPDDTRIYHYRIIMKDKDPLDPGGGVKP